MRFATVLLLIACLLGCPLRCAMSMYCASSPDGALSDHVNGDAAVAVAGTCCGHCRTGESPAEKMPAPGCPCEDCDCQNCVCKGAVVDPDVSIPQVALTVAKWHVDTVSETASAKRFFFLDRDRMAASGQTFLSGRAARIGLQSLLI